MVLQVQGSQAAIVRSQRNNMRLKQATRAAQNAPIDHPEGVGLGKGKLRLQSLFCRPNLTARAYMKEQSLGNAERFVPKNAESSCGSALSTHITNLYKSTG